jgi:hypothetical protein
MIRLHFENTMFKKTDSGKESPIEKLCVYMTGYKKIKLVMV